MSEGTPKYTISLGLAPTVQFAKGAMLVTRGETVVELIDSFADVFEDEELAKAVVQRAFKLEAERIVNGVTPAPVRALAPAQTSSSWRSNQETKTNKPSTGGWKTTNQGSNGNVASTAQTGLLFKLIGELGWELADGADFIAQALELDAPPKIKQMSKQDAMKAIDALKEYQASNSA